MEARKRVEAINGKFPLPEAIIQHIQSFLNGKQAARTSILSKSWYRAWLTRPSLDFDQRDFGIRGDEDGFWNFTKTTIQRYEESKLKIESFRLWMRSASFDNVEHNNSTLATELILKVMKLGAIDLNFELNFRNRAFNLPLEVFGSENLIRLSVTGCRIDVGADAKVCCRRLKSLSLRDVVLEGDTILRILLSCPLIDKLLFCHCARSFKDSDGVRSITRSLQSVIYGSINSHEVIYGSINLCDLHKLKSLALLRVKIDSFLSGDLSSKFPCLKDLSLYYCTGYYYKEIELSSSSLERISFVNNKFSRAKFDVPSIRKFKLKGSSFEMPSLSFTTASREWESDVYVTYLHPSTSWFLELKKLLITLSPSKITLSLRFGSIVEESVDLQGLPKPVVETLWIHEPFAVCSAVSECLFRSCRPKVISYYYWLQNSCIVGKKNNDFFEALWKSLVRGLSENRSTSDLHGLEEVNVKRFEESLAEWRPLPMDTLLDALASPGNKQEKVCFQLKWGSDSTPFK